MRLNEDKNKCICDKGLFSEGFCNKQCKPNHVIDFDSGNCVCDEGYWPANSCNIYCSKNTKSKDTKNLKCICKEGFDGDSCDRCSDDKIGDNCDIPCNSAGAIESN